MGWRKAPWVSLGTWGLCRLGIEFSGSEGDTLQEVIPTVSGGEMLPLAFETPSPQNLSFYTIQAYSETSLRLLGKGGRTFAREQEQVAARGNLPAFW